MIIEIIPNLVILNVSTNFEKDFIYLFLERGREGEREGEIYQCVVASHTPLLGAWPATQACALTGNQTSDLSVHRPALNPLSHTSQGPISTN